MTDFRELPIDIQRELAYNAMSLTYACTALAKLTQRESPEVWAQIACQKSFADIQVMSDAAIQELVAAMEEQRQKGHGVMKVELNINHPKGFGK